MNKDKALKIFLSYSIEDREKVLNIYDTLYSEGFKPWMDSKDIQSGLDWKSSIEDAIKNADVVLIFLSTNSINKRGFLQKEIRLSLDIASEYPENTTYIIPVKLDDCEVPKILSGIQPASLYKKDGWASLVLSLNHRSNQLYGSKEQKQESEYATLKREEADQIALESFSEKLIKEIFESLNKQEKQDHERPRIFVAMPFNNEMEDIYYYGIQRAIDAAGFECYRSDKNAFVGDILQEIKDKLSTSVAVVADLTGANPNVYLEVGYAWGNKIPTILIMGENSDLKFDVRGQKCLTYSGIRVLEEILTKELKTLKLNGVI